MSAKSPRFPRCAAVLRGNDSRCQKDKALLDVAEVITPPKTNVGDFLYCQMILRKVFNQPQVKTTRGGRTKSVINAKQKLDKVCELSLWQLSRALRLLCWPARIFLGQGSVEVSVIFAHSKQKVQMEADRGRHGR